MNYLNVCRNIVIPLIVQNLFSSLHFPGEYMLNKILFAVLNKYGAHCLSPLQMKAGVQMCSTSCDVGNANVAENCCTCFHFKHGQLAALQSASTF